MVALSPSQSALAYSSVCLGVCFLIWVCTFISQKTASWSERPGSTSTRGIKVSREDYGCSEENVSLDKGRQNTTEIVRFGETFVFIVFLCSNISSRNILSCSHNPLLMFELELPEKPNLLLVCPNQARAL